MEFFKRITILSLVANICNAWYEGDCFDDWRELKEAIEDDTMGVLDGSSPTVWTLCANTEPYDIQGDTINVEGKHVSIGCSDASIGCVVTDSVAESHDGAFHAHENPTLVDATIHDITFMGFTSTPITVLSEGTLTIERCTFEKNYPSAVRSANGNLFITDSSFTGNRGQSAVAIGRIQDRVGTAYISGSFFQNNKADNAGGALKCFGDEVSCTVHSSTFEGNKSPKGGAVYCDEATCDISESFFSKNNAKDGPNLYCEDANCYLNPDCTVFTPNLRS